MNMNRQYEYKVGGTLGDDAPSYVMRQADEDLYAGLAASEFCYVLNSRQMGKSSLEVRARKRLGTESFACALIDLTKIGTQQVTVDQWYATLVHSLVDSFGLQVELVSWWEAHRVLTPLARLGLFMEQVLLEQVSQNIIIVIDEIDSVLSLEFPTDDFFAFIRACYNQRNVKPAYQRLTFVLIGVATPSDLIADKERTPFNLGRAIELHGFRFSEVHPLVDGLEGVVARPEAVLEEILYWTGGQPFLTQKICRLIRDMERSIADGEEAIEIEHLVRSRIISAWESQDEPEHLRTIRNRIFRNDRTAGRLLGLYQQILEFDQIPADDSPEQVELRLSGLVVKQDRVLRVYNQVYREVFNKQWVQEALAELRPYVEAMAAWFASDCTDESRLLHGKALRDALAWAEGKQLGAEDRQFLESSQVRADRITRETSEQISKLAKAEAAGILQQFMEKLEQNADRPLVVIQEIQSWAGSQPSLTEQLCQLLVAEASIPELEEADRVEHLVQTHLIQNWQNQDTAEHLRAVCDAILGDEKCVSLLQLYQTILRQEHVIADDSSELRALLRLGLVENQAGQLIVANRIYRCVFNQEWVHHELLKAAQRRIIRRRYEVVKALDGGELSHTYLVKDRDLHNQNQYVLKQLSPKFHDIDTLGEARNLFNRKVKELEKLNGHGQIPRLLASFEESEEFYTVQEFVEGHNLDREITSSDTWEERKVVDLLIELLEILQFIHRQELCHLNLKPANLMRRKQDGKIVLIDFGTLKEIYSLSEMGSQDDPTETNDSLDYLPPTVYRERSDYGLDIYAAGMIGIQALTGRHPRDLNIDKRTCEVIWRFIIGADKPMVQVSDGLAKILSKMVRHSPDDQYLAVAEVLQDLRSLKERPQLRHYSEISGRRMVLGGVVGLVAFSVLGYGFYTLYTNTQTCNTPITAQKNAPPVNSTTVGTASRVVNACNWLIDQRPSFLNGLVDRPAAYLSRGNARLLQWKNDLNLKNLASANETIQTIEQDFQKATQNQQPKSFFYLGLAQYFQDNSIYQTAFQTAIDSYLKQSPDRLTHEDLAILSRLVFFLNQKPDASATDLDRAKQINQLAIDVHQRLNPSWSRSLRYNQGSLDARRGNYADAIATFQSLIEDLNSTTKKEPPRPYLYISKAFTYILWGNDLKQADDALKQALIISPTHELTAKYKKIVESCLPQTQASVVALPAQVGTLPVMMSPCPLNYGIWQTLKSNFNTIFPIAPVYQCHDFPALSITKDKQERQSCAGKI